VHEVRRVVEIVTRVHERLADVILVGHGDDGRQLGDDAVEADVLVLEIREILGFMVEGRQRANDPDQNRHRVGVTAETLVELHQLLVHHGVVP
jgi:hypothetical protein